MAVDLLTVSVDIHFADNPVVDSFAEGNFAAVDTPVAVEGSLAAAGNPVVVDSFVVADNLAAVDIPVAVEGSLVGEHPAACLEVRQHCYLQ